MLWAGWSTLAPVQAQAAERSVAQGLDGARGAEIHLSPSVATLRVSALSGSAALVAGTVQTGRGERLERDFEVSGDTARFRLESQQSGVGLPIFHGNERRAWDLRLSPEVPLALDIDAGVGRMTSTSPACSSRASP